MSDQRNWKLAFLQQARADWEAYQKTHETFWPACHRLHFLQMATEKLGKALLLAGQAELERVTSSHAAFVKFVQVASYDRNLQIRLKMTKTQLKTHFRQLLPIAYEIEILAPALARNGPNPEYPWRDRTGKICIPVVYSFPQTKLLQSPNGLRLLKHLEDCMAEFEKIFLN